MLTRLKKECNNLTRESVDKMTRHDKYDFRKRVEIALKMISPQTLYFEKRMNELRKTGNTLEDEKKLKKLVYAELNSISRSALEFYINKEELADTRRELIGEPEQMHEFASAILEVPEGKRQRARRAINPNFATDVNTKSGLCKQLESEMYRDELYALAKELDLPVTQKIKKHELCKLIADQKQKNFNDAKRLIL